jgi:hypothetical protein
VSADDLQARVRALLDEHDPSHADPHEFLGARFDAGLAWVHFPVGSGGLDLSRSFQAQVENDLTAAGAPPGGGGARNGIGMGMAAPTIAAFVFAAVVHWRTHLLPAVQRAGRGI